MSEEDEIRQLYKDLQKKIKKINNRAIQKLRDTIKTSIYIYIKYWFCEEFEDFKYDMLPHRHPKGYSWDDYDMIVIKLYSGGRFLEFTIYYWNGDPDSLDISIFIKNLFEKYMSVLHIINCNDSDKVVIPKLMEYHKKKEATRPWKIIGSDKRMSGITDYYNYAVGLKVLCIIDKLPLLCANKVLGYLLVEFWSGWYGIGEEEHNIYYYTDEDEYEYVSE